MRAIANRALLLIVLGGSLVRPSLVAQTHPPAGDREKALHVLNRLGFGPRPGDVDRVVALGIGRYVESQLHPERLGDAAVDSQLRGLATLSMPAPELFSRFERPVLQARRELRQRADRDPEQFRQELKARIPPEERPERVLNELEIQKVLRAVSSERQLNEVMVDFWMNHFNVFAGKGPERVYLTPFERDAIRPHIWGKFADLLLATARSPAMLLYLDNAQSAAVEQNRPAPGRRLFKPQQITKGSGGPTGLNENYARELMELHTLGVDGGYSQRDVTELARILTGWSFARGQGDRGEPAEFLFRARLHDIGPKTFLGQYFPPRRGEDEGERALHILALHPKTANRLAFLLCRRLVSDDPPPNLVEAAARRYLETGGDLRETLGAIVRSPEFLDPQNFGVKVKSPLVLAASALRAIGAQPTPEECATMARRIAAMGEPLYRCQPPTGYSDVASAWVNTGALLERLNFSVDLCRSGPCAPGFDAVCPESLAESLTGGRLSAQTLRAIEEQTAGVSNREARLAMAAGLILGSPEFQRM
jgi:uncharacterized protein (DUF1800 family)